MGGIIINKLINKIACVLLSLSLVICNFQGVSIVQAAENTVNLSVSGEELYDEAYKILQRVNKERKAAGVPPLTMNKTLMKGAMKRSAELSIYYSHTRPNGASCFSIEELSKIGYNFAGENIAANYSDATSVMNSWMKSSGHKKNILSSKFKSIGIGVFKHNGSLYFTQVFTNVKSTTPTKPSNKKVTRSINTLRNNTKISINEKNLSLKKGSSKNLYVKNLNQGWPYVYANLNNSNIKWTSSNKNVAKISKEGMVLAVSTGESTIKATLPNGTSASCKITVPGVQPLSKVTNLHVDSKASTSIKFDWNNVSRASGYSVYRSTSKDGTYKKVGTVKSSYYSNNGLTKGKKYYYKVRAFKTVDGKNYYGSYSSVLSTCTSK